MAILSPAKTMDMGETQLVSGTSRPRLGSQTKQLAAILESYTPKRLSSLMSISDKLAQLNAKRWDQFGANTNQRGAAALCFRGDVYQGFEAWSLDKRSLGWAQDHIRILSGLYGMLRPMDIIQPYRLEMGTRLKTDAGKSLYEFWGDAITKILLRDLKSVKAKTLVNLASNEYFKAVDEDKLGVPIVNVKFLQRDGRQDKFISFFAKRARGLMARWMSTSRVKRVKDLAGFDLEGYRLDTKAGSEFELVFKRPKPAAKRVS